MEWLEQKLLFPLKGKGEIMMKSRVLSIDSYTYRVFLLLSLGILITGFILLLKG
jgi:hypothetical protein